MEENKSYTMKEMAERKFELPFGQIFSFQQLDSLKKLKVRVDELWKDHKPVWDFIDKLRMISILYGKEEIFKEWKEKNKFSFVGFQKPNQLWNDLHLRTCIVCGEIYKAKRTDQIYCSRACKQVALRERQEKASNLTS